MKVQLPAALRESARSRAKSFFVFLVLLVFDLLSAFPRGKASPPPAPANAALPLQSRPVCPILCLTIGQSNGHVGTRNSESGGGQTAQACRCSRKETEIPPSARSDRARSSAARAILRRVLDSTGKVMARRVAEGFGMSTGQLADTVGLSPETLYKAGRSLAPKTQTRMREMLEIVSRISDWAGGKDQAMAWYRAEPIPAFGGRTAESIVKTGQAASCGTIWTRLRSAASLEVCRNLLPRA